MPEIPGSFYLVALPSLGVAIAHLVQDNVLLTSSQLRGKKKRNSLSL